MSKIFIQDFIFQPARKTAAEWEAENPVLKDGEVGVELGDPAAVKIGDGVTPWNGLEYSLNNAAKQDKWAETAESNTSDGKKRTTLTGKAGHYLTLKSQESISVEGGGIELKPSNGCLKLNSGNGSGKVKVQNVAEPTAPTEAATKNYVDSSISGSHAGISFSKPSGSPDSPSVITSSSNDIIISSGGTSHLEIKPNKGELYIGTGATATKFTIQPNGDIRAGLANQTNAKIHGLTTPADATGDYAATKGYVDTAVEELSGDKQDKFAKVTDSSTDTKLQFDDAKSTLTLSTESGGTLRLNGVGTPLSNAGAANKYYVDTETAKKQDKFAEVSDYSVKITKPFTVSTGGWPGDGLPVKLYGSEIYLGAGDSDEDRITVEAGNLVIHQSPREGTEGAYDVPNVGYLQNNFVLRSELETDLTVTYGEGGVYYSLANAMTDSKNIYCIIKGSDIGDSSIKKIRLRNVSARQQGTSDIIEFSGIVTTGGKMNMLVVHVLLNNSAKSVTWEISKNAEIAEVL